MMPSGSKKQLYIASNVGELNALAENKLPKVITGQCRMYVKSADRLLKEAKDSQMLGDEERAYVLFMKYCSIVTAIRATAEYKKAKKFFDDVIDMKNLISSLNTAEELAAALKLRYEEREAIEVSQKLDALDMKKEKEQADEIEDKIFPPADEEIKPPVETNGSSSPSGSSTPAGGISPLTLYTLLQEPDTTVLIIDVRSSQQYDESRINTPTCINVPQDIIQPGTTVPVIQAKLPDESLPLWQQRATMDHIVLLDWESTVDTSLATGAVLRCLKDALYKWDSSVVIKSEPLVLEGGYGEWLLTYPTLTTNSAMPKPPPYSQISSGVPSLSSIDYDLDLQFLKTEEELEQERKAKEAKEAKERQDKAPPPSYDAMPPSNHVPHNNNQIAPPRVDRTVKPPSLNNANNNKNLLDSTSINTSKVRIETIHNNLNKQQQQNMTNLEDLRKTLEKEIGTKDTEDMAVEKKSNVPQPVPNRALKPKPNVSSQDQPMVHPVSRPKVENKTRDDEEIKAKIQHLEGDIAEKEKEAELKQKENQRLAMEHKTRLSKLEKEESELEELRKVKSREAKETADLMREKRKIQAEIDAIKEDRRKREEEERLKQEEIMSMQREKDEEKERMRKETERLRQLRKEKEDKQTKDEEERLRLAEIRRLEEDKIKREEEIRQLEEERKTFEAGQQKKREEEEISKRLVAEEQERLRKVAAEQERKKRLKEEEARRIEAESKKMGKELATKAGEGKVPAGWERRYDTGLGKVYYINHKTKSTHWELPSASPRSSPRGSPKPSPKHQPPPATAAAPSHYKAKLRDDTEPSAGKLGGGLSRSHSSPNIAKMLQDEEERKSIAPLPQQMKLPPKPKPKSDFIPITTDISAAKVRNLQPTWGNVGPGLTGLRNLGNTCYMNSTMQCLCNSTSLAMYFLSDTYRSDINRDNKMGSQGQVTEEFAAVIKALWSGQYKSVTPRDFKNCIGRHRSMFSGYDQQDSQELLLSFMDILHEDLNKVRVRQRLPDIDLDDEDPEKGAILSWQRYKINNESIIVDFFQGQFKSTVMCQSCGKKSVTFDAFMFLSLEITSPTKCTLRDCLLNYSKEERMTGESRWHCPRCKCKRDATKRIVIWRLPPMLIIVLKRFNYQGMWRQKMNTYVDFEIEDLDMNKFISGPKQRGNYNLYGVSNHYGTMEGGHYTAYCRNPTTKRWYKFDDHEVYEISKSDIKSSAAYFLCYSSMRLDPNFVSA